MKKRYSGSAISRYQVFTLADGTFVVQWGGNRVQELLTGQYREFDYKRDFGHAITNYELAQLKTSGRVEHFNRNYVWLYALPEAGRFGQRRVLGRGDKIRAYYLVTNYPRSELDSVRSVMKTMQLDEVYTTKTKDSSVVLLDKNGAPFRTLSDAETAQKTIVGHANNVFDHLAIAFIETSPNAAIPATTLEREGLSLDELIASQTDTTEVAGKSILLALVKDEERDAFSKLFEDMGLDVKNTYSAPEAIELLEDLPIDLFIMDIKLPESRGGWPFVNAIREVDQLRSLPILLVANQQNMGGTVANVDYLLRPVSIARLRQNVWTMLAKNKQLNHSTNPE